MGSLGSASDSLRLMMAALRPRSRWFSCLALADTGRLSALLSLYAERKSLTLVCKLYDLSQILLKDFQGAQLFLFVLHNWLRRDQLLGHPARYQHIVFLRYLNPALL